MTSQNNISVMIQVSKRSAVFKILCDTSEEIIIWHIFNVAHFRLKSCMSAIKIMVHLCLVVDDLFESYFI